MRVIRSFVIRIYRQGKAGTHGVVEDVKTGKSVPFHSAAELWEALRSHRNRRSREQDTPPPESDTD